MAMRDSGSNLGDRVQAHVARRVVRLHPILTRRLAGAPTVLDGQELDLHMQLVCQMAKKSPRPPMWELPLASARREYEVMNSFLDDPAPTVPRVSDRTIPGPEGEIPVRIVWPRLTSEPLPVLVYLHGGGYVIGNRQTHDVLCRRLAVEAGCIVVSVDYRLAPEHPFPAPTNDCLAAFRWVAESAASLGGDPTRVAIAGDSAGGCLSTVVCQLTRGQEHTPCFQLLLYPGTDLVERTRSRELFEEGFVLEGRMIDWFLGQYIPEGTDKSDARLSPLRADDLSGLPPAYLITAGFDPLRDEGKAYADAMRAAGVSVRYRNYEGFVHGFATMSAFAPVRAAITDMADALAEVFGADHA